MVNVILLWSSTYKIVKVIKLFKKLPRKILGDLRICSCLACVYRVMDARGKFGEHERCVRVARGDSRVQL